MDNKIISLGLKAVMALLLVIGVVMIWNTLSYSNNGDVTKNQEFFKVTFKPSEDALKTEEETVTYYEYVLDNDKPAVYDLSNNKTYQYEAFINSEGKDKQDMGAFKNEEVDAVLLDQYNLQGSTGSVITYAYWVMIIGMILIGLFTVLNFVQNPKRFIPSIIGTVVLVILAFICFNIAPEEGVGKVTELGTYTPKSYHWSGTGIILFITLAAIAFALIVVDSIMNLLRGFSK
ncbi:MAG: hypothetical protein ACWA41_03165 [Putridiphycobacter sp.]